MADVLLPANILDSPSVGAGAIYGPLGAGGSSNDTRLPGMPALKRGFLRRDPASGNARYNFMFNPTTISTSLSYNITDTQLPKVGDPPRVDGTSQCQVGLYIDRQTGVPLKQFRSMGAMYDVQYIWRLLGINSSVDQSTADNSIDATYMTNPAVAFVFSPYMQLNGWVGGIAINYVKFNSDMTPTVLTITFTLQVIYAGTQTQPNNAGTFGLSPNVGPKGGPGIKAPNGFSLQ